MLFHDEGAAKNTLKNISYYRLKGYWDEGKNLWWFSIVDIVGAITESPNPRKYWSVLKTRLKKAENELTTSCSQLKLTDADGKKYATDCLPQDKIEDLVKSIPNKNATDFLDWFTYSDNTIDGKSKKKAYTFWESHLNSSKIKALLRQALTNKIDDREIFMKGIDYSYYYEQAEEN